MATDEQTQGQPQPTNQEEEVMYRGLPYVDHQLRTPVVFTGNNIDTTSNEMGPKDFWNEMMRRLEKPNMTKKLLMQMIRDSCKGPAYRWIEDIIYIQLGYDEVREMWENSDLDKLKKAFFARFLSAKGATGEDVTKVYDMSFPKVKPGQDLQLYLNEILPRFSQYVKQRIPANSYGGTIKLYPRVEQALRAAAAIEEPDVLFENSKVYSEMMKQQIKIEVEGFKANAHHRAKYLLAHAMPDVRLKDFIMEMLRKEAQDKTRVRKDLFETVEATQSKIAALETDGQVITVEEASSNSEVNKVGNTKQQKQKKKQHNRDLGLKTSSQGSQVLTAQTGDQERDRKFCTFCDKYNHVIDDCFQIKRLKKNKKQSQEALNSKAEV